MIKSLQSLRLVFAVMIFLHHFPNAVDGAGLFAAGGALGVCFFIMLSGFVMSAGYGDKVLSENFDFKHYFLKRLIRLWPLHLLCLLGFVVLHLQTSFSSIKSIGVLGINSLMLQSWIPIKGVYFSGNAVSWCLCDLMFCYMMFPVLYRFINKVRTKTIVIIGLLVAASYFVTIQFIPNYMMHAFLYISPVLRLLDFVLGILAYIVYTWMCEGKVKKYLVGCSTIKLIGIEICSLVLLIGCILTYPCLPEEYRFASMWWLICFILIILYSLLDTYGGGYLSKLLRGKMLQKLSAVSFTFYMIHQLAINVLLTIFVKLQIHIPYLVELIICLFIIMLAALIVNKFFEKPVANYLSKKYE